MTTNMPDPGEMLHANIDSRQSLHSETIISSANFVDALQNSGQIRIISCLPWLNLD